MGSRHWAATRDRVRTTKNEFKEAVKKEDNENNDDRNRTVLGFS
jgi:hypothetical protein